MTIKFAMTFVIIAAITISGCAGVKNTMRSSEKKSQWNPLPALSSKEKKKKEKKSRPPQTMAVIWKDSVLEKPGSESVKGFGGRIYFYDAESKAVKADGELVIYGFDDSDKSKSDKSSQADRKFVFPADQLQSHHSNTDLGASYSVWIPWEKVGGFRKTITLIPVFKTKDGMVLKSGSSINVLPGKSTTSDTDSVVVSSASSIAKKFAGVRQAGFESGSDESGNRIAKTGLDEEPEFNQPRIRTSTISLTPALATRMSATPVTLPTSQPIDRVNVINGATPPASIKSTPSNRLVTSGTASTKENVPQAESSEEITSATTRSDRAVFGSPGSFR